MEKGKEKKEAQTLITTYGGDIYIIKGKTPDEVQAISSTVEKLRMPNGSWISPKSIATMQSYADYNFQTEQKARHRKGHFLKSGEWHDQQGSLGISSELHRITGEMKILLPAASIKKLAHKNG